MNIHTLSCNKFKCWIKMNKIKYNTYVALHVKL